MTSVADHEHDVDPPCETCGGRAYSGCTCPRGELTDEERELGREMRLTRREIETRRTAR